MNFSCEQDEWDDSKELAFDNADTALSMLGEIVVQHDLHDRRYVFAYGLTCIGYIEE